MQRVPRKASIFGAVDLADALASELRVPLSQLAKRFSFDEATEAARSNARLMHGKRTENMFEYVVASLGKADLITKEDMGTATSASGDVQAPDYFVALRDGSRFLVEVKNRHLKDFQTPVVLNQAYLARLRRYAELKGYPLLIAIYWSNLRQWTINKASDITGPGGSISVTFADALRQNMASVFGDRMLMAKPPLICRLWADTNKPRTIDFEGIVNFTIKEFTFHMDGQVIVDERERELAMYFMFHSSWAEHRCEPFMTGDLLDYIEFESAPTEGTEAPEQPMQSLGTLAGMIANYYNWLTVSEQREILRLTPDVQPGRMGSGLEEDFKGSVLKLWVFSSEPGGQGVLKAT
jgi:hypothetical protein